MQSAIEIDLETALRDLLECFEPTSPPTICTATGEYVQVTDECEEAISNAERVLSEDYESMG